MTLPGAAGGMRAIWFNPAGKVWKRSVCRMPKFVA
jgi:hypothetical protein